MPMDVLVLACCLFIAPGEPFFQQLLCPKVARCVLGEGVECLSSPAACSSRGQSFRSREGRWCWNILRGAETPRNTRQDLLEQSGGNNVGPPGASRARGNWNSKGLARHGKANLPAATGADCPSLPVRAEPLYRLCSEVPVALKHLCTGTQRMRP